MRRTFRHWTPRYIANRVLLEFDHRRHPDAPWLTKRAYEFLEHWLSSKDEGLEWGSGRSTLWFAERVRKLTSVEHDPRWHQRITADLKRCRIANVDYHFASTDFPHDGSVPRYVQIGADLKFESLDFVLVDGQFRDLCTKYAISRLKPGGLLIIDNAEWYLTRASRAPGAIYRKGGSPTELWSDLDHELSSWRCLWTSNGVWDTAIFAKPVAVADSSIRQVAA